MTAKGLLAGGILLFATGVGAGLMVGGGGPMPSPPPAMVPVPSPRATPKPVDPIPAPQSPGQPTSDSDALLRAWLGTLPEPEILTGTGVLTGAVRDAKGKPIPGVEVRLTFRTPREMEARYAASLPDEPDLVAAMDGQARLALWTFRAIRRTETDAAGEFRFDGLPQATMLAFPKKRGWKFTQVSGPTGYFPPGSRLEFAAVPGCEVGVEVLGPDGTPTDPAYLFTSLNPGTSIPWTSRKPRVTLPAGVYDLTATSGNWGLLRSEPTKVDIPAEGEPPAVTLRLRSTSGVHGHLLFPGRKGPSRVSLFLLRAPDSGPVTPTMIRMQGQESQAGDYGGWEFAFRDLAPGRYVLGVFPDSNGEGPALHTEEIEGGDSVAEREVTVPLPDRSRILVVRVLGPDGASVRGARVQAQYIEEGRIRAACYDAALADDGSYMVAMERSYDREFDPARTPFDAVRGLFRVTAQSGSFGAAACEARPAAAPEAVLRFTEPGSLAVAIEGYRGSRWQGRLQATLASPQGAVVPVLSLSAQYPTLHSEGRAVFPAVQPGEYELCLSLRSGRSTWWPIGRIPVAVGAGDTATETRLPALHAVRISGVRWRVTLTRPDDPQWRANTDLPGGEGVILLDGLPAGEYKVDGDRGQSKTFTLPGTGEVSLGN